MTLSRRISGREWDKFQEDTQGDTAVNVVIGGSEELSGSLSVSGLKNGGRITEVSINNTSWTALPAIALNPRNALSIQNKSGEEIKINYSNAVVGYVGIVIPNNGERFYDISDGIIIYAKSSSSVVTVNVEEIG